MSSFEQLVTEKVAVYLAQHRLFARQEPIVVYEDDDADFENDCDEFLLDCARGRLQ